MIKKTVTVMNEAGLHVKPLDDIVKASKKFRSKLFIEDREGNTADCRSISQMLSLGIQKNEWITVIADGSDEKSALKEISELIERETDNM